jgi:hypothetical protein
MGQYDDWRGHVLLPEDVTFHDIVYTPEKIKRYELLAKQFEEEFFEYLSPPGKPHY